MSRLFNSRQAGTRGGLEAKSGGASAISKRASNRAPIAMDTKIGDAMDSAAKNKKRKANRSAYKTEEATNTETYTPRRGGNYG